MKFSAKPISTKQVLAIKAKEGQLSGGGAPGKALANIGAHGAPWNQPVNMLPVRMSSINSLNSLPKVNSGKKTGLPKIKASTLGG